MLLVLGLPFALPAATFQVTVAGGTEQQIVGATLGVQPGDTIEVEAGNYRSLSFQGIEGSKDEPVTIINTGGQVRIENDNLGSALTLRGCRHVQLTGTGHGGTQYGFAAAATLDGRHTVNVIAGSSFIEIDHVEVFGAGFAGFNVKDEPTASGEYNRGSFLMEGIELHHNYVHDTGGEGFYIGHTFYNGFDIGGTLYYPHLISGLRVHHNHVERTGAEGIQVGSVIDGMEVYNNLIESPGIDPFANFQNNGMQIGMSAGWVVGNTIRDAAGNGIIVLSQGDNVIACNVIERAGNNGMFVDDREVTQESIDAGGAGWGPGYRIFNNTIVDSGQDTSEPDHNRSGVRLYAVDITDTNHVYNNLVIGGPGENYAVSLLNNNVPIVEQNTVWSADGSSLGLTNAASGDYTLQPGSSLINAGSGIQRYGVFEDAAEQGRAAGSAPDVGAYEFQEPITTDPLDDSTTGTFTYNYRLYTPSSSGTDNPLPLIIFLHGLGERGTDNEKQVTRHIQPLIDTARGSKHCAFLLAPQSPSGWFNGTSVAGLVQEIIATHPIDTSRVYVTGLSAGGQGTWVSLAAFPDLYAAGVPLHGVQHPDSAPVIAEAGMPIWAFHGDSDGTVNVSQTRNMISLLEVGGLQPRYTEIPGNGHSGWSNIYNDAPNWTDFYVGGNPAETVDPLYPWLFRQVNTNRQIFEPGERVPEGTHFFFDFGNAEVTASPDANNIHWNSHLNGAGAGILTSQAIDRTGMAQPLGLTLVDPFNGNQPGGVVDSTLYPATAQQDTFWSGDFDELLAPNEQAILRFSGLPNNALCRLTIFASRTSNDGGRGRLGRYTADGKHVDLDASDNTNVSVVLENVSADEEGRLELTIQTSPDGTARFAYLGVLELEVLESEPPSTASSLWMMY
jgi:predicted esterase